MAIGSTKPWHSPSDRDALEKGRRAEQRFIDANKRDDPHQPHWKFGVRRASDEDDHKGIDMYVDTDIGPIPVQIKSSWMGMIDFEHSHPGSNIAVVIVRDRDSLEAIRSKTNTVIGKKRLKNIRAR